MSAYDCYKRWPSADLKYNENHDPDDGRFTTGDGGSGGSDDLPAPRRGIRGALDHVGRRITDTVVGILDGRPGESDDDIADRLEGEVDNAAGDERALRRIAERIYYGRDGGEFSPAMDGRMRRIEDRIADELGKIGGRAGKSARHGRYRY